jgi:hypothetical protein
MGKKSLIQSTSKKKKTDNRETAEEKPVVKAKATGKTATDRKSAPKPKSSEKGKDAAPPKVFTLKDLLFKKFEPLDQGRTPVEPVVVKTSSNYASPPFFAGKSPEEIEKMRSILARKYSMAELIAAAEKAAAEKAAAEKAAAEKVAAEKAAAEKAAAEKAAAEKAAAEKAAAEKVAAEKAAVEKAAAEKAAAEKAAAERAAAEKVAAEKAAAEKAAAEKAAAEKAAAEKADARKAASVKTLAPLPPPKKPSDPQEKVMKISLGAFALVILYLVMVSYSNMNTFHLKAKGSNIELWQGKFSPNGDELVVVLADVKLPSEMKATGSQKDIFPFVAKYYIDQADRLYQVPGIPDFKNIEYFLDQSMEFAVTPELEKEVSSRLTAIDFSVLLNKAEIAIQSGTPENLEVALEYLGDAKRLDLDQAQAQLIADKTNDVQSRIANLDPEKGAPPAEPETVDKTPSH